MELIDTIRYNQGLAEFLQSFVLDCPNHPTDYVLTDVDILKQNFCRYTKRTMYYAENFVKNLNIIESGFKERNDISGQEIMTLIPDNIFFDFDAFLFSCKSLVEGKVIERAKGLHNNVRKQFITYSKGAFENFIKNYLNPLRDEVVHINNFGSAIGSMVHIKEGKIMIRAFDYSEEMELKRVFTTVLTSMSDIIKNVAQFIMLHECYLFGFPTKDIKFVTGYGEYKTSDFVKIEKNKKNV